MVIERNRLRVQITSTLGACVVAASLAISGCKYEDPPLAPRQTDPGTTVARVVVLSGPPVITAGDSAFYTAKAYDSANNEMPVTLGWSTSNQDVMVIDPSTGRGLGLSFGDVGITASVGSKSSAPRITHVNPRPAFP